MYLDVITKKAIRALLCVGLVSASTICFAGDTDAQNAQTPTQDEVKKPTREELFAPSFMEKLSLMYGHLIQKSMNNPIVKMDTAVVIQGIKDGQEGKPAPMSDKEYEEAIGLIQQYAFEDMAQNNLKDAAVFLEKNAKEEGVVTLDGGKVQYKIMQAGSGDTVTEDSVPTIHYSATYSNGQKLGSSEQQGGPIAVPLDDTIPGFRMGVMGMHAGEKRRIFVHPELAYGASGPLPNGLLIFDIEVTSIAPKQVAQDDDMADDEDDDFLADNDGDDDYDDDSDDTEEQK